MQQYKANGYIASIEETNDLVYRAAEECCECIRVIELEENDQAWTKFSKC
ncbi:hypothetical protein [Paenibacillus periandrae]|nr:hypothetical protein [Paenibacillus periandrae]